MDIGFYTSVSGMTAYQQNLDTIAHNLANINTIGFKPLQGSFSDLLYTKMDTKTENTNLVGHGVVQKSTNPLMNQGNLNQTDRELDFAILGDGFFAVDRGRDGVQYTRNGDFNVSIEGDELYLTSVDGGYVLDGNGDRIVVPTMENGVSPDLTNLKNEIGVYLFQNPYGLISENGSSFTPSVLSGVAISSNELLNNNLPYTLVQGAIETSAVDTAKEMSDVITIQKAFQFNAKMLQTADEVEDIINNLR